MIGPEGEADPSGRLWLRKIGCPYCAQRGWLTFGDAVTILVQFLPLFGLCVLFGLIFARRWGW